MATNGRGSNPLDRLRSHYDDADLTCSECGYEDEDGGWTTGTDGREIRYQHVCPNCGKVTARTLSISK